MQQKTIQLLRGNQKVRIMETVHFDLISQCMLADVLRKPSIDSELYTKKLKP